MNHVWIKNKGFKPQDGYYEEHKCSRCEMVKTKHHMKVRGKSFFDEYFERSGIRFGFVSNSHYIPKCLDWGDNALD